MNRHNAYWLPIIAVLLLVVVPLIVGRGHKEDIATILERADSLAKERPNEAITLVTSYDYDNDYDMCANAYYTHALSHQKYNNLPMAALMLDGAANALENYHNPTLEGKVYQTLGDIYFQSGLFSNSYDTYSHAAKCFDSISYEDERYHAISYKGWSAFKLHRYDEALELLNLALEYSSKSDNAELSINILQKLCAIHLYTGDMQMLNKCVELLDEYTTSMDSSLYYYCIKSIACASNNDIENAHLYMEQAKVCGEPDNPNIKRTEYYIYRYAGDDAKSIESLEAITKELEKVVLNSRIQPMLNDQIELLKRHVDKITYMGKMNERRNLTHKIILIIVFVLLIHNGVRYRRKVHREMQQYIEAINELQLTSMKNDNKLEPLVNAIDRLYNDRLSDVNQLCEIYYEHSDTPRQAGKVFEEVHNIIESIKSDEARLRELEELVDKCRNGLMSKLREGCNKLNEREIKVALYSYAGFSSRAICIFVDSNPVALSKMKYRIKTKIKESNCEDAETLISALN